MSEGNETPGLPFGDGTPLVRGTVRQIGEPLGGEEYTSQEIFLPVSGFVWFSPQEIAIINHPAFQRLAKINQLGQAHFVFRGATHKRIEHVLGAVGVAQKMITAIRFNTDRARLEQEEENTPAPDQDWRAPIDEREERFIRLGALLHDIGHLAAGHTLEDELGLFGKHDEDQRLDFVFGDGDAQTLGRPQWDCDEDASLADLIDQHYREWVPNFPELEGPMKASRLVRLLIRKPPKNPDSGKYDPDLDDYKAEHKALFESSEIRANVCTNIIGNTICADLLDYLGRDWYHVGAPIRSEDRIFQYMEIRNPERLPPCIADGPRGRRHFTDKFVIALGSNAGRAPKIRTDGVSAILGLLERRYELAETVLYHRTKLSAGAMLGRALFELWKGEENQWRNLLDRSDEQLVDYALNEARQLQERLTEQLAKDGISRGERSAIEAQARRAKTAENLLQRLRWRRIYKAFYTERHWSITSEQKEKLTQLFAPGGEGRSKGADHRTYAASLLEQTFRLEPGSIAVSLTNVKPKIAQVEIRVNERIRKFNDYEDECEKADRQGLSGGHLEAQVKRFGALWRLDFFMEQHLYEELKTPGATGVLDLMKDAIDQIFVNPPPDRLALKRAAQRIATAYDLLNVKAAKSKPGNVPPLDSLWAKGDAP